MPANKFVHLRMHSEYSLVDGMLKINPLLKQAKIQGHIGLALTDLNNLFALIKFYNAARSSGIKPIVGVDLLLENPENQNKPFFFTLLAINNQGYKNLCELISKAWLENQKNGLAFMEKSWLQELNSGLIALSGGIDGELGFYLQIKDNQKATECLNWWSKTFDNRFYLEVQRRGVYGDEFNVVESAKLADKFSLPLVATNSVYFLHEEDFLSHETRVCIAKGELLYSTNRQTKYTKEEYFKTPEQMAQLFADLPSAIENSYIIAQRCNVDLELGKSYLPDYPIPKGMTVDEYFIQVSNQGLQERLNSIELSATPEEYQQRLNMELDIIIKMGFPGYFLIVMDFINYSKNNGVPVGPGRGSGAGSLVAYALKITDLDPLKYDLLFERFLNPERVSLPDFDVDFCIEGRDKVIEYVTHTYGKDSVAQIVTFGTMAAKGVVRDVARVLGKPYAIGDKISKFIPMKPVGIGMTEAYEKEPRLAEYLKSDEEAQEVWDMALKLEGLTRNIGKHAGGVVIAPSKLTDFSPIMGDEDGNSIIVQYDKNDIEKAGLVKFDFLGLKTLTTIKWALEDINAKADSADSKIDIDKIDLEDLKTFHMLQQGETSGVFQLESSGMRNLVKKLAPDRVEDLIALVALYRPGPLESGMVDDYIARKKGIQPLAWPHPDYQLESLAPALEKTYGIILYQEEVMQIAQIMAGYSLGGADLLRRAMGKKNEELMREQRLNFVEGSVKNGINEHLAGQIYDLVEKFAGYGFNKSHSAVYGLIAYQTAWLKTNYPAEYMAAFLSGEMHSTDKIYALLQDLPRLNLQLENPNVNKCFWKFKPSNNIIFYGLGAIKGTSEKIVDRIVEVRNEDGEFKDIFDLCLRIGYENLNKRAMEALLYSGALDCLGDRQTLSIALPDALKAAENKRHSESMQLGNLFDNISSVGSSKDEDIYKKYRIDKYWTPIEKLSLEKQMLGFYLTGHPIDSYTQDLQAINAKKISQMTELQNSQLLAGIFNSIRFFTDKKGKPVCLCVFEDDKIKFETRLRDERVIEKIKRFKSGDLVILKARVKMSNFTQTLEAWSEDVFGLEEIRNKTINAVVLNVQKDSDIQQVFDCLTKFKQSRGWELEFIYRKNKQEEEYILKTPWRLAKNQQVIDELEKILPKNNISFKRYL